MCVGRALAVLSLGLLVAPSAWAHHNPGYYFDMATQVEHENVTVVSFTVANPHGRLVYRMRDEQGNETEWVAELPALNMMRRFGVTFQSGALWSSMTLAENVALTLGEFTDLSQKEIREVVSLKLALVGLAGFEDFYPNEISGGMQKRAALARAMALDPDILFFDEPSAGLDPISSRLLDDLILELRDSLGATVVMVTHELASIFAIGNNSVYLDPEAKTMVARGHPKVLLEECTNPTVQNFLRRGETKVSVA